MKDVELIYMKNIERGGEIIDTMRLSRLIVSVEELTKKAVEQKIEENGGLGDADFIDVYFFHEEAGQWAYGGSYTRNGWAFSVLK